MVSEGQGTFQDGRREVRAGDPPRSARNGNAAASLGFSPRPQRDLRLDFFRGLALFFIFIDHTTVNVFTLFTLQSFAFCDAAEAFIFISGVAAALAYGGFLKRHGALLASAKIYRRIWQLYVAYVFSFVVYVALVAVVLGGVNDPALAQSSEVSAFLSQPSMAIARLLVLRFHPGFFEILPLYMLLLAGFPPMLMLIRWRPLVAIGLSAALYLAAHRFGWALYAYPDQRPWGFNPLTYQFLFVIGAVCGYLNASGRRFLPERSWIYAVAGMFVAGCAVISFSHAVHSMYESLPLLLPDAPWGVVIGKRDLSLLRLVNFLALALAAAQLVRRDAPLLSGYLARPVVLCGQNSLPIFCQGILLSTVARFILEEITDRLRVQLLVILAGVAIMIATAYLITWYKRMGRAGTGAPAMATTE